MTLKPTLVSVAGEQRVDEQEERRLQKLKAVLGRLEPRGGPSEQAVKTALYDGEAEALVESILEHTILGLRGKELIEEILVLEPSGELARFLATELKYRANEIKDKSQT